jgi:hypothetical protein
MVAKWPGGVYASQIGRACDSVVIPCSRVACFTLITFSAGRMGDIINLRRARKAKTKVERDREAEANRAMHGRTRVERNQSGAEKRRADRKLDGHRLGDETDN